MLPGSPKFILMATYLPSMSMSPKPAVIISRASFCCKFSRQLGQRKSAK